MNQLARARYYAKTALADSKESASAGLSNIGLRRMAWVRAKGSLDRVPGENFG